MNRLTLIATATLLVAALVGGVYLLAGTQTRPPLPTATPAATAGATAITTATTPQAAAPAPEALWGDWQADVEAIPAINQAAGRIQLSVSWENGQSILIQKSDFQTQVLQSVSIAAASGELRMRSLGGGATNGCAVDAQGRYGWNRSADGLFLTLTLIEDACPARAATFSRVWVHSLGAVNDGGPGVVSGVTPNVLVTLPTGQRYGAGGGEQSQDVKTFGDAQPFRAFAVIRNPGGFGDPCSATDTQKRDIDHTVAAFETYVEGLPGATVTTSAATIDGRPASKLDVSIDTGVSCASTEIQAFHPEKQTDENSWTFAPGEIQTLYIVQMDASTTFLMWYQGSAAEAQPVLDSISFIDNLPTP